ncbi:type 4a pilus biogenesis protein PilO [Thermodesulfobacteriota bacterium]
MTPQELFFKINPLLRLGIVLGVCLLIMGVFYFLLIHDCFITIDQLNRQIDEIKVKIKKEKDIKKKKPQLKAKIGRLKKNLRAMVDSLPEKQDIELLLKKITELLSQNNLLARRFVPGKEQVNTDLYYAKIPITLNLRGDYNKQGAFLASLNDLPRVVNVPSITLKQATGLTAREKDLTTKLDVVALESDINGVTYRRLSPDEIKKIQQAARGAAGKRKKRR